MKDVLDKLSSYNIFNYLLPGVVFVALAELFLSRSFIQKDVLVGLFFYYFIGMIISRVGSLVVEPLLKKTSFVCFAAYADFVNVTKTDPKVEVLSEQNNMYRTFCALFILLIFLRIYEAIEDWCPVIKKATPFIAVIFLVILFLFSYRKQTLYITKRVEANRLL
ncbi:MAG: hypothetical protein ACOX9C_02505 [Kiritimatiellia bacterium]|jgi:hypothetical protein